MRLMELSLPRPRCNLLPPAPFIPSFSLGVCVAEIFGGFSTGMERARVVMRLMEPAHTIAHCAAAGLRGGGDAHGSGAPAMREQRSADEPGRAADLQGREAGLRGRANASWREAREPIGAASGILRRMVSRCEGERPSAGDVREEAIGLAVSAAG
jgi:hypothetical protein